eukprot:TRINITY_DN1538_c0_g1_i2.p1 TRINITY_DN1538_c0_g1~~TRINITY_DN1538_c0_g1_i2.p1  ORF type:complete len:593 (-),score=206.99 TRINITY_DN1538_c0_g1_i2:260-2038(-)
MCIRDRFSTVQVRIVGQTWDWKSPQSVPGSQQWSGTAWFVSHQDIGDGTVVEDPNELLLITNAHVAADALYATIMVPSAGSHPIEVDVIGTCVARDLAMLRVKNPADLMNTVNWKPAMLRLGDSDKMKRAGQVMVLGYPLGLAGVKASMGFVSGYQQFEEQLYLQVTAPIDGGNSGGPLLDELGEVVGVVSAKIAQASGMSFAIPAVELKALLHVLYTRRAVYLPLVGLSTPMVTSRHARDYFGVSAAACTNQSGLLIDSVMPSSLLSGAGVQPGDVLLSLDGASVDRFSQVWVGEIEDRVHLTTFLARKAFGEELSLHVWRGDKLVELQVVYDSTPALAVPQIPETVNAAPYSVAFAGVTMMNLTYNILEAMFNARLAKFVDPVERLTPHVLVVNVDANSPAGIDGSISQGYLVNQVNGQQVSSLAQVCHAMVGDDSDWVTIHTDCGMIIFSKEEVIAHECSNPYSKPNRLCEWPCPVEEVVDEEPEEASPCSDEEDGATACDPPAVKVHITVEECGKTPEEPACKRLLGEQAKTLKVAKVKAVEKVKVARAPKVAKAKAVEKVKAPKVAKFKALKPLKKLKKLKTAKIGN